MRVVLVGLEMWVGRDGFQVSPQANDTLEAFLHWRAQHLLGKQPHDNAQLITTTARTLSVWRPPWPMSWATTWA